MKIKTAFFGIAVLLLCFSACKEQTHENEVPVSTAPPAQIISVETAKEMYDSYTTRRVGIIKEYEARTGDTLFDPSRYGWYDYETLKQYMAFIEKEAQEAGVEISGISFYFTNYPDKQKFNDGAPIRYPRQNSFFLLPTMNEEGKDIGFLTSTDANGTKTAVPVNSRVQFFKKYTNRSSEENKMTGGGFTPKMLMLSLPFQTETDTTSKDQSLILNEANIVPPPKQDTDMDG